MANQPPESRVNRILDRRKQLKQQRQRKQLIAIWRTVVTVGLAAGLTWAMGRPDWKVREPSQVSIVGNKQLATQALAELLPLTYPTSLIRLDPQKITKVLQTHAHLNEVVVARRLFPPRIQIAVQERAPVAITVCDRCMLITDPTNADSLRIGPANVWLLDAQGIALPIHTYPTLEQSQKNLPVLTLAHYLSPLPKEAPPQLTAVAKEQNATPMVINSVQKDQWKQAYPVLKRSNILKPDSSVHLSRINWQNPNNLTAQTTIGPVHFGPLDKGFADQLDALYKLRDLSNQVELQDVVYIDVRNPQQPVLEKRQPPQPAPPPP